MHRRRRHDISATASIVDAGHDPGPVADPARGDVRVPPLAGRGARAVDGQLAAAVGPARRLEVGQALVPVHVYDVERVPGAESDVRLGAMGPPALDLAAVGRRLLE